MHSLLKLCEKSLWWNWRGRHVQLVLACLTTSASPCSCAAASCALHLCNGCSSAHRYSRGEAATTWRALCEVKRRLLDGCVAGGARSFEHTGISH